MKKRVILLVLFVVVLLSGCEINLMANVRLSELRDNIFIGEDSNYKVVVVTGTREEPFSIDGNSNKDKKEFTIVTVTPNNYANEYAYKIKINGSEYSGKLVRHPYNQTYSCEISAKILDSSVEIEIMGINQSSITATSVKGESFIDGQKAYTVAHDRLKKGISEKLKTLDYEIFVRLIENPINSGGGYYWYVAFIFTDDTVLAVLIDPITVEIVAVKE